MSTIAPAAPETSRNAAPPLLTIEAKGDQWALIGALNIHTLALLKRRLRADAKSLPQTIDIAELQTLDTPGALFLCALQAKGVILSCASVEHLALLKLIGGLDLAPPPKLKTLPRWRAAVIAIGRAGDGVWQESKSVISFAARALNYLLSCIIHPSLLRPAAISRHVVETGVNALPIVGTMAVMISIVIGYQSVAQLRPFGADELTVDLIAVSMLREMAVLVTAIMVAGRSGAAFAAELGVMKTREEVDALSVMGLDPMEMLVLPRLIALIITLPLLTFFADIMGLVGGAAISSALLALSPGQYLDRVHHAIDLSDFMVGMFKAPVFAAVIAIVGCMHGLRASGSAESVGQETTRAVVKAIFLVIVLDAFFSIVFERLGL